jgi:hypothetical protein
MKSLELTHLDAQSIHGGIDETLLKASFQNGREGGQMIGELIAEGIAITGWVIKEVGSLFGL